MSIGDVRVIFVRMMLKASGSTCYNAGGITFPRKVAINFEEELRLAGGIDIEWMPYSWPMLVPDVITWIQGAVSTCEFRYRKSGGSKELVWSRAVTPFCFVYKREWYDLGLLEMPFRGWGHSPSISVDDYLALHGARLFTSISACGPYDLMEV